jgi:ferredoxin-NADP reductase
MYDHGVWVKSAEHHRGPVATSLHCIQTICTVTAVPETGQEHEMISEPANTTRNLAIREVEADLVVKHRDDAAEGVAALTLAQADGSFLPDWTPGAHIDLLLGSGLTRQYSLCGSTADRTSWRIGVLRDPGSRGGSEFVHEQLQAGAAVRVRGPRNHFPLVVSPKYLFIAGGIGITPILAMIESAAAAGADWTLLYGGRSRASMAFIDELEQHGDRVQICPQDESGLLDLKAALGEPLADMLVYTCGPGPLLDAVESSCAHWPAGSLHMERFAAKEVAASEDALDTFEVVCQRSGTTVTVTADQTIYDALEEAGVDVLGSCLEGICGTCEAAILEGEPDHRDSVLSDAEREEGGVMMICVSRSCSQRLVLDL